MATKFEVGQSLLLVIGRREPTLAQIVRVGRKWLYLEVGDIKVDASDLDVYNKFSRIGRCYLSREDFDNARLAEAALRAFKNDVERLQARGLSASAIAEARKILGMKGE